ncbi:MAG: ABC transporter ATP-binding protein [Prevotella sp.]|nr:ABC transporter ATP-binding protein [Prevotella sp.]
MLSAQHISIGYAASSYRKGVKLYDDLSFDLDAGELTCLLGANGAGKSTLLKTLSAMQPPLSGHIFLHGKSLSKYSESELSRELGVVLTDRTSVGGLTVTQLVALGRYPYTGFFGRLSKNDHAVVEKAMSDVGVAHKAQAYMAELSDGERQKAMIAKTLAQECPVILLDEPTAFLDIASRIEMLELLHQLTAVQGKTILLSTHDVETALLFADRLWLLSRGQGLECGATEDMLFGNSMALFLERENITFDRRTGSFRPVQNFDEYVFLQAEGDLKYWTQNFLRRNGWDVTDDEYKAAFSLKAPAKDRLFVRNAAAEADFDSFEKLRKYLFQNSYKKFHNQKTI